MNRNVTIVMYHYVRDLKRSRFPAIKGLSIERFCYQLDYIEAHYTPIAVAELLEALAPEGHDLPPNPILLTFDDGYSDHFTNVFPRLDARGIQGCFFPPAQAILEHKVLDVNKIQFVLATVPDAGILLDQVFSSLAEFRSEYALKTREAYLADNFRGASLRYPRGDSAQAPAPTRTARASAGGNCAAIVRRARHRRRRGFRLRIAHVRGPDRLPAAPWNAHRLVMDTLTLG